MGYKGFEDLEVWQRSKGLCIRVFKVLRHSKEWSVKDQLVRSALSIPSNISEGSERRTNKEFVQFLGYSKGSAGELRTQLLIAGESGIIEKQEADKLCEEVKTITSMLQSLIKYLEKTQ